jgi:hypothetical protein
MAINKEIRETLPKDSIILDNYAYDNSIIGVSIDGRVIYSFDKMVEELIQDNGWTPVDAVEWIEYNTIRALPYMGENAPIICEELKDIVN